MQKGHRGLRREALKHQSKLGQRFFGNHERWRVPHCAGQYHFVVAVWRAKEAECGLR
jgi:phosphopantetheinyl transferase (holo-ACP synthase)